MSFLLNSRIIEKVLLCLIMVQSVYSAFPCAILSFMATGASSWSKDPAVVTVSSTAGPTERLGEVYSKFWFQQSMFAWFSANARNGLGKQAHILPMIPFKKRLDLTLI